MDECKLSSKKEIAGMNHSHTVGVTGGVVDSYTRVISALNIKTTSVTLNVGGCIRVGCHNDEERVGREEGTWVLRLKLILWIVSTWVVITTRLEERICWAETI